MYKPHVVNQNTSACHNTNFHSVQPLEFCPYHHTRSGCNIPCYIKVGNLGLFLTIYYRDSKFPTYICDRLLPVFWTTHKASHVMLMGRLAQIIVGLTQATHIEHPRVKSSSARFSQIIKISPESETRLGHYHSLEFHGDHDRCGAVDSRNIEIFSLNLL